MQSRASFFNITAFRKNILRFAPVWALYTVFLLLVLFAISILNPEQMARTIAGITVVAGWANFLYSGTVAMCLFGDLYKTRLCCALHAFPLRREGWLLTNIVSGLLFSLIPNVVVSLITSMMLGQYAYHIWILVAVAFLQYLFFFGVAVLGALCAGNRLGMLTVTGIFQFIVVVIQWVAESIYQPLFYGIELATDSFYRFFPLSRMTSPYVQWTYGNLENNKFSFVTENWVHLALCAVAGVVCMVLAWQVYRRRHLERAGDFLSLRSLRPVLLIVFSVAVGVVFYAFSKLFGRATYVLYAAGIAIGFFCGQMLLDRTLRVFHKKSLLAFGILVVALAGSMVLTWTDPFDVSGYTPTLSKVENAAVYGSDSIYIYRDPEYSRFEITDPDEIAQVQELHKQLAQSKPASDKDTADIYIRYTLTNGRQINRYYQFDIKGSLADEAGTWFGDMRYLFRVSDTAVLSNVLNSFAATGYDKGLTLESTDPAELAGLLEAIKADCEAGKMNQNWIRSHGMEWQYSIQFSVSKDAFAEGYRSNALLIREDCTNTLAFLKGFAEREAERKEYESRLYYPDVVATLENNPGKVVIKEWKYIQGTNSDIRSYADIYYQKDGIESYLGTVSNSSGHCAFMSGQYMLKVENGELFVSWAYSFGIVNSWYEESFPLPQG